MTFPFSFSPAHETTTLGQISPFWFQIALERADAQRKVTTRRNYADEVTRINFGFDTSHVFFLFRSHFARAHLALGATGPVGQTSRNRLKIGVRREGTVSNQLLETQRLPRTDG